MSAAIAAGLLVLICAAILVVDLALEHLRHIGDDRDADQRHDRYMAEIRRQPRDEQS